MLAPRCPAFLLSWHEGSQGRCGGLTQGGKRGGEGALRRAISVSVSLASEEVQSVSTLSSPPQLVPDAAGACVRDLGSNRSSGT